MNTTPSPALTDSTRRVKALLWIGTTLGVIVLSAGLVWLVAPELGPYAANPNPAPIHHLSDSAVFGQMAAAALQACLGAAGSAVGLAALFGRAGLSSLLGGVAVVIGVVGAVGLTGLQGLVVAGYSFAHALPLLIPALLGLAMRTPRARVLTAVAGLATSLFITFGPTPLRPLYLQFGEYLISHPARSMTPLALLAFAGVWLLAGTVLQPQTPGRIGRSVLRHRVAITTVAAACSVPYVIARLSWLTPWPLLGDPREYEDATMALINGLLLGAAMLAGGVLTLGLIRPWGTHLPRWFGGARGRPVPVALVVVPASIAAILFTAAGVDSLLLASAIGTDSAMPLLITALVFPFWLWGPLLALATWGYALHRRSPTLPS